MKTKIVRTKQAIYDASILWSDVSCGPMHNFYNRIMFMREVDASPSQVARARVQHGSDIHFVNSDNLLKYDLNCDALITTDITVPLAMPFADCPTVVIVSITYGVLAVVHAGWRSIADGVLEKTVNAMYKIGAHPRDLRVFIGPGIRKCCYRVGADVAEQVDGLNHIGKVDLELTDIIMARLIVRGVGRGMIRQSGECTSCSVDNEGEYTYFSYRRQKVQPIDTNMLIASLKYMV